MVALTLLLDVTGNQGSSWPTLNIKVNNTVYINREIQGHQLLNIIVPESNNYLVEISGIGKRFGQDGIWDTILDANENIIADKSIVFNDVKINDISMEDEWIRSLTMLSNNEIAAFKSKGFYTNGIIKFSITNPILNWVIHEKFIKNHTLTSQTYSGRDKFDHQTILNKIIQIRQGYLND